VLNQIVEAQSENQIPLIGSVEKYGDKPIMLPQGVGFESKAVFNPSTIVRNDTIYMFYRAEDWTGHDKWKGTSTIGMAYSTDGIHFNRKKRPVIIPEFYYEIPGGCEDPRVVQIEKMYYMTYTAYDGKTARLALASSPDLVNWEKKGIIIPWEWSKAGAMVPEKINGKYVMYFLYYGDKSTWIACSQDMVDWEINDTPVLTQRENPWENRLVEPGPTPIIWGDKILLIYNGSNKDIEYYTFWALFEKDNPNELIERCKKPVLSVTESWEKYGQVPNVLFVEGLVHFKNRWYLYYGAADTYIGLAISNIENY
jgi:predicted GH43/DUF377 family glycosyl hydrolase